MPQRSDARGALAGGAGAALPEGVRLGRLFNGEDPRKPAAGGGPRAAPGSSRAGYFTLKLMALLAPAVVVTLTLTVPNAAVVGTLHVICVALQET